MSYRALSICARNRSDAVTECPRAEAELARSMARLCALIMPAEGMQAAQLLSLKAPVAGSVVDVKISPGAILDSPSAPIMTIADLDTIWVTTSLPKRNAPLFAMGQPVEIVFIAYPHEDLLLAEGKPFRSSPRLL